MYQKPDFIKVSVKANDVFAPYGTGGCPENEYELENFTIPCTPSDPNYSVSYDTYTGMGYSYMCYSALNP